MHSMRAQCPLDSSRSCRLPPTPPTVQYVTEERLRWTAHRPMTPRAVTSVSIAECAWIPYRRTVAIRLSVVVFAIFLHVGMFSSCEMTG